MLHVITCNAGVSRRLRVINSLPRQPTLLITPRIPPTAHRRGLGPPWRMTHIFGGKASEPVTSQPVEKRNFYLPHLHLAPPLRVIQSEFCRFLRHKTIVPGVSCGVVSEILRTFNVRPFG